MADLSVSLPYVLENEGGLTYDDGGITNYGIVKSDLAQYWKVLVSQISDDDIKQIPMSTVTAIYREQYWNKMSLDKVTDQNVATCIFDTGVNRGISVASKYAQIVCNESDLDSDLIVDGDIGPKTLAAINSIDPNTFITAFETLEYNGYQQLITENPGKYGIYEKGWDARAERLLTLLT